MNVRAIRSMSSVESSDFSVFRDHWFASTSRLRKGTDTVGILHLVSRMAGPSGGIPQVQGEDSRGHGRLRLDARGGSPLFFERRIRDEKPLPDLIVIDGGKGQLSAAHAALSELRYRPHADQPRQTGRGDLHGRGAEGATQALAAVSPALRLLQQARDEAHRFAVTYNRKRRTMRTVTSELPQGAGNRAGEAPPAPTGIRERAGGSRSWRGSDRQAPGIQSGACPKVARITRRDRAGVSGKVRTLVDINAPKVW